MRGGGVHTSRTGTDSLGNSVNLCTRGYSIGASAELQLYASCHNALLVYTVPDPIHQALTFMETVPSVYTLLLNIIFLYHSTQVAEGTVFRKHAKVYHQGKVYYIVNLLAINENFINFCYKYYSYPVFTLLDWLNQCKV